ncbi:caspase family protein [Phormidesmis sp. 146-12]
MTNIKRRQFLQFAGATFASVGLSQLDFITQADRTDRLLAQPTGRKLALLVGINDYPSGITSLKGCLTDVEMQYELLRHRYSFKDQDILRLTDDTDTKPTRQNILDAFETHLIQQAQPGDVVVFHYSGHGSLVTDPQPLDDKKLNGTLLPADCTLDDRNDIMGRTLFLLSSQLKTDLFTMVLDSCHSGGGTRGNQVVRALRSGRSNEPPTNPSDAEITYQAKQLEKLGWSKTEFQTRRTKGIAKGVALGSAQKEQLAVDASFVDFSAGALTYLLTRYLWQLSGSEPLNSTFDRLALITQELAATSGNPQIPIKDIAPGQPFAQQPVYQLTADRPSAEAVVRQVRPDGKIVFWLGGVSSRSLEAFQPGSLFSMVDDNGSVIGEIEQTGRLGLEGYGKLNAGKTPQPGTLLREKLRNLPTDLSLKVGLDENLGADRAAIAQELQKIARIQVVPINQRGSVNFILGRMTDTARLAGQARGVNIAQPNNSVGLFTSGNAPIANSFGRLDEPPQRIVARLRPQLKMLLARQLLSLTLNGEASQLKVDVDLKSHQGGNVQVLSRGGSRSLGAQGSLKPQPARSIVDINIVNREKNPVYLAVLSIGDDGTMTVLHPANWDSPESASVVKPQQTTTVPMEVYGPAGFFEVLVITSASQLRDTLRGLQTIARGRKLGRGSYITFDGKTRSVNDSEDSVVQTTRSLVSDITRAGARPASGDSNSIARGLDPKLSGVFSAILQVVD